jgi:vitamin B12 transporter
MSPKLFLKSLLPLFASLPFAGYPALAEEAASDDEETIVVIADRVAEPIDEIGSSVGVLDQATIETRQDIAVLDLLQALPGISISRNGGLGAVAALRIRGAEAGQTLVLIDGVKVNDLSSPDGAFNFANLTADNIERIEVLSGPQSTLYGSDAIGGVINIITKKATGPFSAGGSLEAGSFATVRGGAHLGVQQGGFSGSLALSGIRTGGISAADADAGNTEKDPFRTVNVIANLTQQIGENLALEGFFRFADSQAGFDAFSLTTFTFVDGDGVTNTQDLQGAAGLRWTALNGRLENRARVTWAHNDRFDTENGGPSFDAASRNHTFDFLSTFKELDALTLLIGAEAQGNRIRVESFGDFPSLLEAEANIASVFAEAVAKPVAGLNVTFGVRHDDHERFGGHTTFRATAVYLIPGTNTRIRGNWGEGFKAPTLFQLFSPFGDPNLRPEESTGWEAGLEQDFASGRAHAAIVYFHRDTTNQIDFDLTAFRYNNILATRAKGVEIRLAAEITERLVFDGNYTRIDAENAMTGLPLARRPKNLFNANLDYKATDRFSVGGGVHFTGQQMDAGIILDAYKIVDLRVRYRLSDQLEIYGRIENAFNEDYQTVKDFGTPGIAAFFGIRGNY